MFDGRGQLGRDRLARQCDQVELASDLVGGLPALGEPGHPAVIVPELAVDRRPTDELKRLREIRVAFALTLASELARRSPESLQEWILHLAIGDLSSAGTLRQSVELSDGAGQCRDRIQQDLGRK